jgi:hypothetical protein
METTKVSFPQNLMLAIRREAGALNLTPGQFIRMRMSELFREITTDGVEKSYIVRLENWQEAEAYVKVKYPGSTVGDFAVKAIFSEMKKHGLKSTQKGEFDRLLGN